MSSRGFLGIQKRIQKLYRVLGDLRPIERMNADPFDSEHRHVQQICRFLDSMVAEAEAERRKKLVEIERLIEVIKQHCKDLEIEEPDIQPADAISLYTLRVVNELRRVMAAKEMIRAEMSVLEKEIGALERDSAAEYDSEKENDSPDGCFAPQKGTVSHLPDESPEGGSTGNSNGDVPHVTGNIKKEEGQSAETTVTLERLRELRKRREECEKKRRERESLREAHTKRIQEICYLLDRECVFVGNESISKLEKTVSGAEAELESRIIEHRELSQKIRDLEKDLEADPYSLSEKLDDVTVVAMREHYRALESEHSRRFREIFERTKMELLEVCSVFGLSVREYTMDDEGLSKMKEEIAALRPKKGMYCEILATMDRRKQLLEKMTEFEKIASDPGRLFRSLFQLNSEEKFRNTAYPTLLRLEEALFKLISEYEDKFGTFLYQGMPLASELRHEIDSRIINRTVFISRCDSPYRKKTK